MIGDPSSLNPQPGLQVTGPMGDAPPAAPAPPASPSSSTKRRGWPWLVAVPMLLVAVAYFASRPELDPRLSGRWGYNASVYVLTADGGGEWIEKPDGSGESHELRWWMDGPVLVIDKHRGGVGNVGRVLENASLRLARRVDFMLWEPDDDYTYFYVTKIEPESIRYRTTTRDMKTPVGQELKLPRLPE